MCFTVYTGKAGSTMNNKGAAEHFKRCGVASAQNYLYSNPALAARLFITSEIDSYTYL